jgi:hypothetical protein
MNFPLHNEQMVNGLKKIAWASVFYLKRQHIYLYTGCVATPCSALSQASCQSQDDQRWAGLLPEGMGAHVGIKKYMQKVSLRSYSGDGCG